MTSREIICRNLEQTGADRIGMNFKDGRMSDIVSGGVSKAPKEGSVRWTEGNIEFYEDVWGNTWHRIAGMSRKGEIYKPALEDWSQLDDFKMPDLDDSGRFEAVREAFGQADGRYRLGQLPGFPFAICRYLRKMEVYLEDLALERENVDRLHGLIADLLERVIDRFAQYGADGVIFAEDWGTQDRLLVSPEMWRDIYKPLFDRLCRRAHSQGLHVLMHSCGYIWEIIDDLAEVGINALQFDQPGLYGLERLSAKLKDLKICLYSPVDIQRVLISGDRDKIENEAREMVRLFGNGSGGLIAKSYGDLNGIGARQEWDQWAYDAFVRHMNLPFEESQD